MGVMGSPPPHPGPPPQGGREQFNTTKSSGIQLERDFDRTLKQSGNGICGAQTNGFGSALSQTKLADIENRVHNRGYQMRRCQILAGRFAAIAVGSANHLTALNTSSEEKQRRQSGPVIPTTVAIDARGSAHLTAAHK